MEESVRAARELGADISSHVAHLLTGRMVDDADLVLAMAAEHRDKVANDLPEAAARTYTLKELVRLLHALPSAPRADPGSLPARIAEVDAARRAGSIPPARDEDVADPLGQPIDAYRAVAWELEDLLTKLVDGLWGTTAVRARTEAAGGGR
jgi:protein-tyrosine phosphatase